MKKVAEHHACLVVLDGSTSHYHTPDFFLGSLKFNSVVLSCKPLINKLTNKALIKPLI